MRIGIFGGSFDPVHKEHVRLAEAAINGLKLDKLIVMPAGIPPHKAEKKRADAIDRLHMCEIAFRNIRHAEVSDYEILQEGKSYTYLTCLHFSQLYPNAQLFWLVGTDMFWDFFNWKNPTVILSCAKLAVCRRDESEDNVIEEQKAFQKEFSQKFETIPYNGAPVSSTEIRLRSILGLDFSEFVPSGVAAYIRENNLYRISAIDEGLSLEKTSRAEHSRRVCLMAMSSARRLHLDETKTLWAAALHDVAKNLSTDDIRLKGFVPPEGVPAPVMHQYEGAYVLENTFFVTDEDVLNAVRYHTSGRPNMSMLEKLVFLSDLLEPARNFPHVDELRLLFYRDIDECIYKSLLYQIEYLKTTETPIYPLTIEAFEYYEQKIKGENK